MALYKPLVLVGGNYAQLQSGDSLDIAIGDIPDVTLTTPADGQVLAYDATDAVWVNADAAAGGGGEVGGVYGINVEALAGDKTLTPGTDAIYQYLDPNGANRNITLDTANASAGDRFVIKHNGGYGVTNVLNIYIGTYLIETVYAQQLKFFIYTGSGWLGVDNGTQNGNLAIGLKSNATNNGVALGASANGYLCGSAVGKYANGSSYGTAVGYNAQAYANGTAVGYNAKGYTYGVGVGYYTDGNSYGVAIGRSASGYSNGVAIGYYAYGYLNGISIGDHSWGLSSGVAIGYHSQGHHKGVAIGYEAGCSLSTGLYDNKNTLIGYKSGYNVTQPPEWVGSTAYSAGDYVVPTTHNGYSYKCVVTGTSDATEPTWPTTIGDTVVDGGVTWECVSMRGNNNIIIGYSLRGNAYDVDKLQIGNAIFGSLDIGSMGCGSVASLPTASEQYRGQFIRVEGGAGVKDVLYICEKDASDNYVWTAIT